MSHPLVVRPVRADDRAAWSVLWAGYNAFYGRSGPTALPAAVTESTWARFLDPAVPVHALVAVRSGAIVGLAHFLYRISTVHVEHCCYLQDLYTVEEARGTGAGRALLDVVADRAREAGAARLDWQTHESNGVARRLYDRVAEHTGFLVYTRHLPP